VLPITRVHGDQSAVIADFSKTILMFHVELPPPLRAGGAREWQIDLLASHLEKALAAR
jgi:hypothetical protein